MLVKWDTGDGKAQGIISHGIDLFVRNIVLVPAGWIPIFFDY